MKFFGLLHEKKYRSALDKVSVYWRRSQKGKEFAVSGHFFRSETRTDAGIEQVHSFGLFNSARVRIAVILSALSILFLLFYFARSTLAAYPVSVSGTAYSNEGTIPQTSTAVALFINGINKQSATTDGSTGAFTFSDLTLNANDILTVFFDTNGATTNGVTVTKATGANLTGINLYKDRLITRCDNTCSLTNADLKTGSGADTDVGNIYSVAEGNLIIPIGKNLIVGRDTFTPGGNVSVGSGVTINGTFVMGSNTLTLSGSWLNKGTFTKNTSTVVLNGGNQSMSGSTIFHNFRKIVTSASTLLLDGMSTQTISGSLTLRGTANQLLKIRATNSGASLSGAPEQPLKTKIGTYLTSCVAWDYNMGYKFTANANGSVTQLGLRVGDATARTVYLYNFATTALLASATVTGVNNTTWVYANITPVSLVSGQTYVVSVRGSGGSQLNCYYSVSSPFTQGNISVLTSIYYPSSNAMPTFTDTSNMYGFADITFVPGGGGGGRGAKLILDGDSGTQTIDYVDVKDNDATGGKRLIDFPGGVDSGNATNWFFGNSITGTVYSNEGTTTITSGTVALSINGGTKTTTTLNASGQYTFTGLSFSGDSILTLYIDDATPKGVTVTRGSGGSLTGINLYQNRLILRSNTGSTSNAPALTNTHLDLADDNGDTDITDTFSVTGGNLVMPSGKKLLIWSGSKYTPGGNVSVGSGITIAGIFEPGSNTITLSGSWINKGTFTKATSSVILDGGDQTLSGSTLFQNLQKIVISPQTLTLYGPGIQSVSGSLTLQGSEGNLLKLRASSSGAVAVAGTPVNPLQAKIGSTTTTCSSSNYNMGYRFTANANGMVTQLGVRVNNTESRTVRLYNFTTGTVLASATVSGVDSTTWVYVNITPVALTSGTTYIVSERGTTYCYVNVAYPFTQSDITVLDARYISNSDAMPNSTDSNYNYGFADLTFVPGGLGGDSNSGSKLNLGAAGSQTIQFVDVKDNNAKWGQALSVTAGGVDSGNNTNWTFSTSLPYLSGTAYSDEGTTPQTSTAVALFINGANKQTTTTNVANGSFSFTNLTLSANDILTVYYDTNGSTTNGVTMTKATGGSLTNINLYKNRLITRCDNSCSLTNANLKTGSGADSDVGNIYSVAGGNLILPLGKKLIVGSNTFAPGGNVSVGSGITIAGTFEPGSNTITLSGSWINKGTFTKATSSVILDGGDQTLSGSTLFQNLQKIVISPQTLTLYGPGIQSVSGSLTLQGSEGNLLKLRASSSGASIGPGGTPISPLQAQVGSTWPTCNWSDYNMGIRFTANTNGSITQLGMRVDNTESRTVRLYDFTSGTVLASATVSGVNTSTWVYVNITPVAITSGTSYIVSERGSTYCGINTTLPFTQSNITVLDGRYIGNSDSMPNSFAADYVYGLADVTFVPQGLISDGGSGSKLNLGAAGSQTIQYVDVKDNNAKWGQTLDATTGGVNSGNNTNWTFSFSSPTSTTLTSSSNPSAHNAAVTFTATVTGSSPTGTVTFKDGATTIGTATLGQGSGTLVTSALTPGYHSITAEYGGDGSNGTSTSAAVNQFVAMTTSSADWAYRKKITVANTNVTADLTDFPLLVKFSGDANIAAGTQSTGNDIRFTTSSGVLLPYEREDYHETSSSGAGLFWVKVPKIKANGTGNGSGATIYLYYGSGSAVDGQNKTAVWDSNFKSVYHLEQATGVNATDSTSNNSAGVLNGTTQSSGQLNGSLLFNGSSDYVSTPTIPLSGNWSVAGWVKLSTASVLFGQGNALNSNGAYIMARNSNASPYVQGVYGNGYWAMGTTTMTVGNWYYIEATHTGTGFPTVYINGTLETMNLGNGAWTYTSSDNSSNVQMGRGQYDSTNYAYHGSNIDEFRVSTINRSAAWVKFEYYNMGGSSNNDLTYATQEDGLPSTTTALTSSQNPSAHNAAVTFTATVTGTSPTGTVTFKDGVTTIGTATLGQGSGTLVTSALTPGYHSITAEYGGDGSNGTSTSAAVNQFVAMATSSTDWAYRKMITVANTNVDAVLTDFPLLVKFANDTNIAAGTQSTGNDIRFATSTGVLLPYEREDYHETSSSGSGLFWVKVPTIKATGTGNGSGATIYLYYGSGSAVDGQNIRNVWDSNFKGVWHLSGATLHGTDSTANGNNSNALNAASAVSGQVDGAANINGATYINVPTHASLNPGAQMTASAWVYPSNATGVQEYLIKYTSAPSYYYLRQNGGIFQFTPSSTSTEIGSVSYTPAVFPTNQWTLVTGTFDGSVSRIYTNGIQRNSTNWTGSVDSNAGAFTIGALGSASTQYYTGRIDETRLSSVARSAAWVKFEYYNMGGSSNNDLTFGAQDNGLPSTTTALTSSQNPSAHNAAVTFTATVTGTSPTGTVTFKDGVTTIGTATLGQGSGTLVTSALTPGYHSITAEYGGDGSNGTSTSTAVSQFVAMATSDADWVYRKKITVANTNVTADLTDFPLLVKFSGDADIAAGTQSTGNDIRFATATGVLLPYEREDYHERSSSGAGLFWVKVPKIKANGTGNGSGATIYLYYGSGSAVDGQTRTSVWDTNFKGVWHLSGATLHATDSTSNGNNGTNNAVTATAGQVDGGGNFNGSSNVDMGTKLPDLLSSLTISTWVKPGATQVAYADIWGNHQDNSRGLVLQQNNTTTNQFGFGYGDATTFKGLAGSYSLSANVWQYVVIVKDPSLCYMYVNGVEQTALRGACTTDVAPATTMNFNLGRGYAGGGRYFNGQLDEARVSASARSASWIKFEYYNMGGSANNDLSLGSEESTNSTTTTLTSSLNPSLPGQSVTLTATVSPSFVTGTITFKDGATTLGTVTLGQGSGSITKSDFTIGRHSLTAVYGGGDGYLTSTSSILVQSVNVSLTGKAYQNDGVTPLTATSVTVASGSAILDSAITDNGGQFTLSGGLALGTVATVFVSGAATKAVTVTVSSGATMTGVNLIGSTLVMRHETGGLLTNSHLVTAKASGNADITAVFNMTGGSLVLAAGKSLLVAPRTTFVPGGRISTSDLTVNGTLTMGTYGLTATGSFITSSGSFSTGTGVTLKPQTLTGNMLTLGAGQSFQNLTLQGPPTIMTATLQPSTDAVDTFLYNPAPTTSYGQSTLFQIGNESFAGNAFRAALGFDLSTIPASATIDNVAMQMYNYSCIDNASGCGTAYTLGLYQLTRTLTEAATWNTYNGTNAWTTAGGDYTTLLGQTSFPGTAVNAGHGWVTMGDQSAAFTSYVQSVVGTGRANLLVKYNTYSYWVGRYYYSSEYADATYHPKLVVTYRSGSDGQKVTLGSGVTINGNFTILNGGLDVSATGNYPIALAGNFINKMGTGALLARRGTVTLTGGSQTLSGSTIFNNLTKNVTSAATLTFDHAGTQTVSGALLLSGAAENLLSLRSTVSAVGARLKLLGSTQSLSYLDVKDNDASGGQTLLCSSKNSGCVSNGNTLNWNFGWYRNWPYRKKIIVANTNVDADLTSFPLLVRFSGDANISARAKSDGSDLRFADVDGNILPYEKEDYHVRSSSGAGLFWVKVPTIKENGTGNGSGATIYLYYGSGSAADGQDVRNVWDTDFKGVWHLSGAVLSVRDSTSNANVGTNNGATATLGMVDGAGKFELVRSTHVSIADATPLNPDQKTLSMWVNVPEYASSNYQHAGKITLGTNGYMLYSESANHKFYFFNYGNTPTNVADTTVYSLNTWYYVTGVYDGSNLRIYRNGIQTNSVSVTGTTSNSNQPFQLGLYASNGQYTNQTADEVRLSSVARTAPWIKFEYYNMGGSSNNDLTFDTEDSLEESATSPQKKSTFWFIDW